MDLTACCVIFLSGLARGILWWRDGWATYDALIGIPLGVFLSYISTIATVFVTIGMHLNSKHRQEVIIFIINF